MSKLVTCHICKETGHAAYRCPTKLSAKPRAFLVEYPSTIEVDPNLMLEKGSLNIDKAPSYNVTLNEGAGFLLTDPIDILLTEGLSGCVALAVELMNKGIYISHISSEYRGDITKLTEVLNANLRAINRLMSKAGYDNIKWSDFKRDSAFSLHVVSGDVVDPMRKEIMNILEKQGAQGYMFIASKIAFARDSSGVFQLVKQSSSLHGSLSYSGRRTAGYGTSSQQTRRSEQKQHGGCIIS